MIFTGVSRIVCLRYAMIFGMPTWEIVRLSWWTMVFMMRCWSGTPWSFRSRKFITPWSFCSRKLFSWHYPLRTFIYGRNPVMDRGPKSRKRLLNFRLKENQGKMSFLNYATQYVDKCNLEYLRTIPEKRKDKLRNIAKRFINQPTSYQNLKRDFEYSAKQYGCSIHELYDPKMEYPEEIEW